MVDLLRNRVLIVRIKLMFTACIVKVELICLMLPPSCTYWFQLYRKPALQNEVAESYDEFRTPGVLVPDQLLCTLFR